MQRQSKTMVIIFTIIMSVVFLHVTRLLVPIEDLLRSMLAPLGSLATKVGTGASERVQDLEGDSICNNEIEELRLQLNHLSVDYVQLHALKEENAVLRNTLGFVEQQGYESVMANIISRSVVPDRGFFMIDRGSKDGIEIGMAVIFGEGVYVGKITKIYERTAIATLTTDPTSKVAISLAGQHKLIGLVEGKGNRTATATLIPQEEEVRSNDVFVTSGTEEKIPPDLVVGIINQVLDESTDPFKEATIEPIVQTDYLNVVAVLRPKVLSPL
ncbi:MAG: rod shape-determining protein MreC [Patescibacteria group bacterium]|nr:rod shape-determining protein MreC [Patescibacteria group bacterium]